MISCIENDNINIYHVLSVKFIGSSLQLTFFLVNSGQSLQQKK